MEYMQTERHNNTPMGCFRGLLVVIIGVILSAGGCVTVIDIDCHNAAQDYFVPYPDSTLFDENHNFIRPFGMGDSVRIYETPDDVTTVRNWYADQNLMIFHDSRFGTMSRDLVADDGVTYIVMESSCAANASF